MNDQVRDIMTKDPVIVSPNQTLHEVTAIFLQNKLQQCPVVEEGKLMGMITTHDLWNHSRNNVANPADKVEDVMNKTVIKITPLDKVGTAAELFMDRRFKTLPVVNLRNELKGVVTSFDVIRYTLKEEYPKPILYPEAYQ